MLLAVLCRMIGSFAALLLRAALPLAEEGISLYTCSERVERTTAWSEAMGYFPDTLTAFYHDQLGTEPLSFLAQEADGDAAHYRLVFRGTVVEGDDFEEIVEQLPRDGTVIFEIPLSFFPRGGKRLTVPLRLQFRPDRDKKDRYRCQWSCW
jgi:hypothetical protein